jgi:pimeloyl-ACP methyl ester carboxylesterase
MTKTLETFAWGEPEFVETNGIKMAVYDVAPNVKNDKPTIILLHGFPELAYSWRHQVPALVAAGHRVIVPDQRGYGLTEAPEKISDYDMQHLTDDIAGMMDTLGVEKAVFCGHDWGAFVLWALPFYMPERVLGLAGFNLPYKPRRELDPVTMFNHVFGEENYINYFQTPGNAETLFERDIEKTFRFFMRKSRVAKREMVGDEKETPINTPKLDLQNAFKTDESTWSGEVLLSEEEVAFYAKNFSRNGFRGPINWYRNMKRNWQDAERFQPDFNVAPTLDFPTLMVTAQNDPVCPPSISDDLGDYCPNLTMYLVKTSGHWTQQEAPDEVNDVLLAWLSEQGF